ncbi:alpha/beta fold hydrolase [Lyngbya confervoides]|uniref:Alpha/beta fold hydrolase n=1 Tax=Lyngbya confervoides BDU141951 TaxID=1574623 RepID=A0ABD4T6K5_9CYAN|nr:alpha/beta fold hydrolase [Lyngbya confervoides]MCM1984339.1 alpha/beta fold hydrolase [Lyngbya confervoides BDU141951]
MTATSKTLNYSSFSSLPRHRESSVPDWPSPAATHLWNWRGFDVRYRVEGEGSPLILLHGFGASLDHWRNNIPALAQHHRVYAIDLLGFGRSEKPPLNYSLELWEGLLCDFWRAQVQQPAVWIGNSIGALLGLMVTARHGPLTRGAVLLNVAGGLNHRPEELNAPLRWLMATFAQAMTMPGVGQVLFNRIRQRSQIRRTLAQVYGNRAAITDELVELLYQPSCDRGAQQVMASILQAPAGPRVCELLPLVRRPLCVLWGEADPWTPITAGQIFQDAQTNPCHPEAPVSFTAIPETGHCPHDERPEIVNAAILKWLAQLPDPPVAS